MAVCSAFWALLLLAITSLATVVPRQDLSYPQNPENDYSCRSTTHPNPVVMIHGLLSTYYTNINLLEAYLKSQGFCTFSFTYGVPLGITLLGGVRSIADSSREVADFILKVARLTGNANIDLVGHSEGAFQSLYVPKFYPQVAAVVRNVVAIGPPTHGTTVSGLYLLAYLGGNLTRDLVGDVLETLGCGACDDLGGKGDGQDGPAVRALNQGPIAVSGIHYTIMTSKQDEVVTPPETAFVNEPGVRNFFIQDYCPQEVVGHLGEPYSPNVQEIVVNTLSGSLAGPKVCSAGPSLQLGGGLHSLPPVEQLESTLANLIGTSGLPLKRSEIESENNAIVA
ncbi:uncharacterized protein MYCFIDRAFT_212443 [Pseudocercospora fijiensis CIRAD86]|uniref:Lipase n=1 Tax=Pseudocercospora fijiensis (strain CIRAD86) TaxID=383855 RepID=M3A2M3_PSEFD|nr:uncharacterized protein MYCFIDRAFT_212443 [Pseudocercospora fijiensis CIRAD86]EME78646.1 hypothetical protein MYCFIDRAFT_212443 [Pseudocercospora fijiensis CIRAD86]